MDDKNKLSTTIIDGQIIDLNTVSIEKINELKAKLEARQEEIRAQIDKILEEM